MLKCDYCIRRKTAHLCYHCFKPICGRCAVYPGPGDPDNRPALLELDDYDRVCPPCLLEHRRTHGMNRRAAQAIIRFTCNRD